jgi:hypothetical protein
VIHIAEQVGFYTGLGVVIVFIAAVAVGRILSLPREPAPVAPAETAPAETASAETEPTGTVPAETETIG